MNVFQTSLRCSLRRAKDRFGGVEVVQVTEIFSTIYSLHNEGGFDYHDYAPRLVMGLPKNMAAQRLSLKVLYHPEDDCIYVNLDAINKVYGDLKKVQREASKNPNFAKTIAPLSAMIPNGSPLSQLTSIGELTSLISRAFGEFFLQHTITEQYPDSWLSVGATSPHEKFARFLIEAGIGEFFAQLAIPTSEKVAPNIWEVYDKDTGLGRSGDGPFWARAGHSLILPILRDYREDGLRYLVQHPLRIGADFGLAPVPLYQAAALDILDNPVPY